MEDSVPFAMMGKSRQSKGTVGSLPSGQSQRRDRGVGNRLLRSFQYHCMAPQDVELGTWNWGRGTGDVELGTWNWGRGTGDVELGTNISARTSQIVKIIRETDSGRCLLAQRANTGTDPFFLIWTSTGPAPDQMWIPLCQMWARSGPALFWIWSRTVPDQGQLILYTVHPP
ncbi:hypothetical protein DPX16_7680 [Anabarilius grahami]|uniref:Uncharacterized protein n=1 Tax=Anabarilius grahami TaxID=495550 RepID=A0A3N0YRE5_ANAGA|nr:hypothetical protein DPX16_7680 [Anabarilius grahami]